jgi:hypothetical protein
MKGGAQNEKGGGSKKDDCAYKRAFSRKASTESGAHEVRKIREEGSRAEVGRRGSR